MVRFSECRGFTAKCEWVLLKCWKWLCSAAVIGAAFTGCAYKGGKVTDGTNLMIGVTIPGTEWTINALDYVGGARVAGNDSTHIVVTNEVAETNSYFGIVTINRHTKLTADIEPLVTGEADGK